MPPLIFKNFFDSSFLQIEKEDFVKENKISKYPKQFHESILFASLFEEDWIPKKQRIPKFILFDIFQYLFYNFIDYSSLVREIIKKPLIKKNYDHIDLTASNKKKIKIVLFFD